MSYHLVSINLIFRLLCGVEYVLLYFAILLKYTVVHSNYLTLFMLYVGIDPPDCLPSSQPTSIPSVSYDPSGQPSSQPSSAPSSAPTGILLLPSNITSCKVESGSVTLNSMVVSCTLFVDTFDARAVVYCAAFDVLSKVTAPQKSEDVIRQQHSALSGVKKHVLAASISK